MDLLVRHATAAAAEHTDGACGEDRDAMRHAVREASGETHPHAARLAGALLRGAPAARLSWGCER
ncbi:hypothetical protein ABT090_21275 [Streptomyces asoensis]|uniref:hypothetical protein n=1 Tax=Streptomyces asoensis TaxID=249586 RepID=UPI00331D46BD